MNLALNDPGRIDDQRHLVLVTTNSLPKDKLAQFLDALFVADILDADNRNDSRLNENGTLQLRIATNRQPQLIWFTIAKFYLVHFNRFMIYDDSSS